MEIFRTVPALLLIYVTLFALPKYGLNFPLFWKLVGGDFIYSPYEVDAMVRDVEAAAAAGAHGVVIGALTPEGDVDLATARRLIAAAGDASVTFHGAFDMARDPFTALEQLVDLGVHRVITSGQESSVLEGAPLIAELVDKAAGRLIVMPGGGINERNIARIAALTGADEFHFAAWSAATARPSTAILPPSWAACCTGPSTSGPRRPRIWCRG